VKIRRSKTDQTGRGIRLPLPYGSREETCPVKAVRQWLDAAQIKEGPVFRPIDRHGNVGVRQRGGRLCLRLSTTSIAAIIKKVAALAGLDGDFSGHSLRRGHITTADEAGVDLRDIMRQSRHKSEVVARGYVQERELSQNPVLTALGL
jgi:integrase